MAGLGDRVKATREELELSQGALAARVTAQGFPITQQGIGSIEDRNSKRPRCLPELARALGVADEWLRSGKGPKERALVSYLDEPKLRAAIQTALQLGFHVQSDAFLQRVIQAYAEDVALEERFQKATPSRSKKPAIMQKNTARKATTQNPR